jgi:hypothetical protein
MEQDGSMSVATPEPARERWSRLKRTLVWASFAWLAVLAGVFAWGWWSQAVVERETPRLVEVVDLTVRDAAKRDPALLDRLLATHRLQSIDGSDVLSEVPPVRCADAFRFSVTDGGAAVIGYRGTCLAEGACVRTELSPTGRVSTSERECSR